MASPFSVVSFTGVNTNDSSSQGYSGFLLWFGQNRDYEFTEKVFVHLPFQLTMCNGSQRSPPN